MLPGWLYNYIGKFRELHFPTSTTDKYFSIRFFSKELQNTGLTVPPKGRCRNPVFANLAWHHCLSSWRYFCSLSISRKVVLQYLDLFKLVHLRPYPASIQYWYPAVAMEAGGTHPTGRLSCLYYFSSRKNSCTKTWSIWLNAKLDGPGKTEWCNTSK